ncbi:MAG: SDR family oxidoreductase [Proteobacteria bacterium]|nr:SDR family oxidoreductase [Pseudomonadota bacterium]HQR03148.1 SDR family oxidoreductase [Rhodocyclaceae bacterium]
MDLTPRLGAPQTGVIITGGASGLGRASAEALAAVGRPVALWDIHADNVVRVAEEIRARHGVATIGLTVDVTDPTRYAAAIDQSRDVMGTIGGFVHSAGVVDTGSLEGITPEGWDRGINIHLRPVALLAQALLPDLKKNPGSAIVAFASINATLGNALNPIYSAGKGGVLSLVRSLADRLGSEGIRINSLSPGQILTPMLQPSVDHLPAGTFERRILLGRVGDPAEVGRVVRFLLSDEASYITASEIVVDGGNISSQRS